jgi:ACS family hexuronate transporter-like MFS transporter
MTRAFSDQRLRWFIVAWITLSTMLNLLCRQGLYILAPVLQRADQLKISEEGYSKVVSIFLVAYAIMYTVGGRFVDWIGERVGLALFVAWWSVWTMMTSLARGAVSLGAVQFLAGLGEPGNYPAGLRAMTNWFAKAERGLPVAIFSSGSALGSAVAVPVVTGIALIFGSKLHPNWRATFIMIGSLGLLWTVIWLWVYRTQSAGLNGDNGKSASSAAAGREAPVGTRWMDLLHNRRVVALVLARLVSDPVWWFFVAWTPKYLYSQRGFSLKEIGLYAWIPFVAGSLGGIIGGKTSDTLIGRGMNAASARLRVLYVSAAFAPMGILISRVPSAGAAIALIGAMALVVYSWFINTAALIPDVLPASVVGSVLGLMGTAGSVGGFLFTRLVGFLLTHYSYTIVFLLAGSMHLLASFILWTLMREVT